MLTTVLTTIDVVSNRKSELAELIFVQNISLKVPILRVIDRVEGFFDNSNSSVSAIQEQHRQYSVLFFVVF